MATATKTLMIRLRPEVHEALISRAQRDGSTMTAAVTAIIEDFLEAHGELSPAVTVPFMETSHD